MQLQVKLQKKAETTYLEANKAEWTYRLTYLDVLKREERYNWGFESPKEHLRQMLRF